MITERATNAIAAGAATSPAWFPYVDQGLSITLSVLGIVWLAVQIYYRVRGK